MALAIDSSKWIVAGIACSLLITSSPSFAQSPPSILNNPMLPILLTWQCALVAQGASSDPAQIERIKQGCIQKIIDHLRNNEQRKRCEAVKEFDPGGRC